MATAQHNEFQKLSRVFFDLLRVHHHLQHVQKAKGSDPTPKYLMQLQDWLGKAIHPARPTTHTLTCLEGNSKNWTHTTLIILEEHYSTMLDDVQHTIRSSKLSDWKEALTTATRWFKKRFPRHHPETIPKVTKAIGELLTSLPETPTWAPLRKINGDNTIHFKRKNRESQPLQTKKAHTNATSPPPPHPPSNQVQNPHIPLTTSTTPTATELPTPSFQPTDSLLCSPSPNSTPSNSPLRDITPTPLVWKTVGQTQETTKHQDLNLDPLLPLDHVLSQDSTHPTTGEEGASQASDEDDRDLDILLNLLRNTVSSRFERHEHQGNKSLNWKLTPSRPVLIIGDSNLARIPLIQDNRIQVDCYPGANLTQATHLLRHNTPLSREVQKVIVSFGTNDREQSNTILMKQKVKKLLSMAQTTFPFAQIGIPIINFSRNLHPSIQKNIRNLNHFIAETGQSIGALPQPTFQTTSDDIHWTTATGQAMMEHWKSFLCWGPNFQTNPT